MARTGKQATNSVLGSIAQSGQTVATPVQPVEGSNSNTSQGIEQGYAKQIRQAVEWIMQSNLPPQEKLLLTILLRNGLRVSEICEPGNIRKIDEWTVAVYCSKNKTWRTCTMAEASEIEQQYSLLQNISYWKRTRWYYYRLLKGLLPDVETQRTGNKAVTHAARNIKAQMTFSATGSVNATKISIGNTSGRATSKYVRKSQKKAFLKGGIQGVESGQVGAVNITKTKVIR
jgi:hypothetical protein